MLQAILRIDLISFNKSTQNEKETGKSEQKHLQPWPAFPGTVVLPHQCRPHHWPTPLQAEYQILFILHLLFIIIFSSRELRTSPGVERSEEQSTSPSTYTLKMLCIPFLPVWKMPVQSLALTQ